jgi:drug/metabolite transporter (DMT)-like permease
MSTRSTTAEKGDRVGTTRNVGLALALGSAVAFGVGPAIAKPLLAEYSPWLVLALRFLTAAIFTWAAVSVSSAARQRLRGVETSQLGQVGLSSLALVVVAGASYVALARLPATLVILIAYTYPAMAVIASRWFGAAVSLPIATLSFGMALLGVVLASGGSDSTTELDTFGLVAALVVPVATAVFMLLQGRVAGERKGRTARTNIGEDLTDDRMGPLPATLVTALVTGATGVAFLVLTLADDGPGALAIPMDAFLRLTLLGLAAAAAIALAYEATTIIGVAATSLVSLVEVAVVVATAALVLGESLTAPQVVGVLLVAFSVPLTARAAPQAEETPVYERDLSHDSPTLMPAERADDELLS